MFNETVNSRSNIKVSVPIRGGNMLEKLTIYDRLEIYAEDGRTSAPLKLWGTQIKSLRKAGFTVDVLGRTDRYGEFNCDISWDEPAGGQASYMLVITIKAIGKQIDSLVKRADAFNKDLDAINNEINYRGSLVTKLNANLADSLRPVK